MPAETPGTTPTVAPGEFTGHCLRKGCRCTHTLPCDRGWLDLPDTTHHGVPIQRVAPCPVCRPEAARVGVRVDAALGGTE